MEATFTIDFKQYDIDEIAKELKHGKGYFVIENVINEDVVWEIVNTINSKEFLVNSNNVGVVHSNGMSFHSHTLAVSKICYDIITNNRVRSICHNFFDGSYKLTNQRFYETNTKAHMPWHTDNNVHAGNKFVGKHNLPGILFLFYLSDVKDTNPFQLISDSQKWSATHGERYFADKLIEQNHAEEVVTVRAPKGTLVICNTHIIHRAEPFDRPGFKRFTFLFQVDALSDNYIGHGEKLLINPAFVDDISPEVLRYLGFGLKANYPTFPQTSVATMMPDQLWRLQKKIYSSAIRGLLLSIIKRIVPSSILISLKNMNLAKWLSKSPTDAITIKGSTKT